MQKFLLMTVFVLFSGQATAQVLNLKQTTVLSKPLQSEDFMRGELEMTYAFLIEDFDKNKLVVTFEDAGSLNWTKSFDVETVAQVQSYTVTYGGQPIFCVDVDEIRFTTETECTYDQSIELRHKQPRLPVLQKRPANEPLST